ncbi:pyridoxal phosphate-dependent aminotransferase [Methylophilaceae bacterium]|nr:pyridoxal phosphate-dependent aminotransferase [Methylophilaceae bacterium]
MSKKLLSSCVNRIEESPTLAITAKAIKLKSEGKDIIALAAGEPDFDTPDFIKDAAIQAIKDGFTKYTAVAGTVSLRQAIVEKFKSDNDLNYMLNEVIVGVGGKQCIFNLCLAILEMGDEVVIPAPYWVSYADIVQLTGAKPIIVTCDISQQFKITPSQLDESITDATKLVFLNSPSNPTGAVYSKDELRLLADILLKHPHVYIGTDDIYEHINLGDNPFYNILMVEPKLKDRVIILNGVSKAYSMTGWRIGFAAGPKEIISAMSKLQSQSTSNPTSISQVAAEAALRGSRDCIIPMIKAFKERHEYVLEALNDIVGVKCIPAEGAFYAFSDANEAIDKLYESRKIDQKNDLAFADYLLESQGVAVVPGSAFGLDGYFRISFATSMDNLVEAIKRIKKAIEG